MLEMRYKITYNMIIRNGIYYIINFCTGEVFMDSDLKQKVDLMIDNYNKLKGGFPWEASLIKHFGAMTHAIRDRKVNIEALEEIKNYIKKETSWMSYFRGTNKFITANLLYFEEDYKIFFRDIQEVYKLMGNKGFGSSSYLPLAAYTIAKQCNKEEWDYRIDRMREFYQKMKANHFWLTSHDDYVYAAVLATSDLNVNEASEEIERCYKCLNEQQFYKGNDLQTLSHILAIGEENYKEKCNKAVNIYEKLNRKGCRLQYSGLAILGLLTLITDDIEKITDEIKEVYDYIYEQDSYGFWSLDKSMRTVLAASLVSDSYIDSIKKGILQVSLGNSINAILIAQQQATIAAATAASAAAASASSSS